MLAAAATIRAVPTIGAIATSTPWTSSRVTPTSTAAPTLARYDAGGAVHGSQRRDTGDHQLARLEVGLERRSRHYGKCIQYRCFFRHCKLLCSETTPRMDGSKCVGERMQR